MKKPKYKRELSHSYLVMEGLSGEQRANYQYKMILKNRIPGLLACGERFLEGETCLYYDISSRQSLAQLYESGSMGFTEITGIVDSIRQALETMSGYLLEEQFLLLEPEYVYMDLETEQLYFLYFPFRKEETGKGSIYLPMAEFLLEHVNHKDERAVSAAYQFYKMSKAENFTVAGFYAFLEKDGEKRETGGKQTIREKQGQSVQNRPGSGYREEADAVNGYAPIEEGNGWRLSDSAGNYGYHTLAGEGEGLYRRSRAMEEDIPEEEETGSKEGEENRDRRRGRQRKYGREDRQGKEKREEKENAGFDSGRAVALAGLILTALLFLCLCAGIWYLQPQEMQKVWWFTGLAADGLALLVFLWKTTAVHENRGGRRGGSGDIARRSGRRDDLDGEGWPDGPEEYEEEYPEEFQEEDMEDWRKMPESRKRRQSGRGGSVNETGRETGGKATGRRLTGEVEGEELVFSLEELPVMVGKVKSRVQILLSDGSVSRIHARFVEKNGGTALLDLNSANGTFVNGIRLEPDEVVLLEPGDEIRFGEVEMSYEV